MTLAISASPTPLRVDGTGTVRIAGTRVTLDTVVSAFRQGATAEQIAQSYPAASLPDVYAVIAYYLHHQAEIDAYLAGRADEAAALRREIEAAPATRPLRQTLLARRTARGA